MKILWYTIHVTSSIILFLYAGNALSVDHKKLFTERDIQVIDSPNIDTAFPIQPKLNINTHGSAPNLSTLVSLKLEDTQDHFADAYVYFPKVEILVPIVSPSIEDNKKIFFGQPFNHFPYLEQGALHYFGDSPKYGNSNMVLAAHSSFGKTDVGRRKTIFQVLPLLSTGDEIHYYEKNEAKSYNFHQYIVQESFETTPNDISILQDTTQPTLTAYTCRPIGTTDNRRVIHADMVASYTDHETLTIKRPAPASLKDTLTLTKSSNKKSKTSTPTQGKGSSIQHTSASKSIGETLVNNNKKQTEPIQSKPNTISSHTRALLNARISKQTFNEHQALVNKLHSLLPIKTLSKDSPIVEKIREMLATNVENSIKKIPSSTNKKQEIKKLILYIVLYQSL